MANRLSIAVAHNVITPLGLTSESNYEAIAHGRSALQRYDGKWDIREPFMAALTNRPTVEEACGKEGIDGQYTYLEKTAILSIRKALSQCDADPQSPRTLLILSTTKGNVDLLRENPMHLPDDRLHLGATARVIAEAVGMKSAPIVVSNACISGACAQIEAARSIASGSYDSVIVCGIEILSPFIITGFQSLKALTDQPCRPFDEERTGINLGDAAATIIYKGVDASQTAQDQWTLAAGAIRNDAYHISAPSRKGEGSYRAIMAAMRHADIDEIAFISAHGTATLFNDEMEAVAIDRAGMSQLPVNSLKGYFGHTMGAAGVVETIMSMLAVDNATITATRGFNTLGVSREINVTSTAQPTSKTTFLKLMSGFGGCNAAMLMRKL